MRHVNKKQSIRGGKKKSPKAQPAILNPPKLGGFKSISSFSVAEIIDLISDGPIEGLVDQNGQVLSDSIFKGIYLDNTPIQNTTKIENKSLASYGGVLISDTMRKISRFGGLGEVEGVLGGRALLVLSLNGLSFNRHPWPQNLNNWYNGESLPLYGNVEGTDIEWHRKNPLLSNSAMISTFETKLRNALSATSSSSQKKFLTEQSEKLDRTKISLNEIPYPDITYQAKNPDPIQYTVFLVNLGNRFIPKLAGVDESKRIKFSIKTYWEDDWYVTTLALPKISNNKFTGDVEAFLIIYVAMELTVSNGFIWQMPYYLLWAFNGGDSTNRQVLLQAEEESDLSVTSEKFNFSNIACEFKNGQELQTSMKSFDKIFNDYLYETPLLGPFRKDGKVQRILIEPDAKFDQGVNNLNLNLGLSAVTTSLEGSNDSRIPISAPIDYAAWNNENEKYSYDSLSVTHTIENPFVDRVSVSIIASSLSDTLEVKRNAGGSTGEIEAGSKVPSIVALKIETGKITNGERLNVSSYFYAIVGLIEGACIIDFGSNESGAENLLKDSIKIIKEDDLIDNPLTQPFLLPALANNEDPSTTKRFITVVKLSTETNSVLIKKEIALAKVTEIIDQKFSYPFSAIAGIKLDARGFGSIPERSYDCKLKQVKIPSNYKIKDDISSLDIRYCVSSKEYTTKKQIYKGDWNGTFVLGWTDNPAWILYDLLTSQRYGLGSYIEESQVNKWELYKIARFCDAVDEEGYFVGVSNGFGGLEPRFSCNIMLKEQTKVYDAINVIASLFRGVVFFGGSEIHFLDDRPRKPIALFSNANIKEGLFNYSNVRRDLQFNTVEVVYLDRFDNYKTKVEYVQDEQDLRKRGVFKTTMNTLGVTSRAMARRIGQHIIHQTIKENQTVSFDAGLEALLCRPGDLVVVEDEMKTRSSNYGRILDVDLVNKKLRIDNQFDAAQYTGFITVYSPTGYATTSEINDLASKNRSRVEQFSITGDFFGTGDHSIHRGLYKFSGYTPGYPASFQKGAYPSQFPLYTGTGSSSQKLFCYYNTGATGFVFATGLPFQDNVIFDKIITNTGVFFGADISASALGNSANYTGFTYSAGSNKRVAPSGQISGAIAFDSLLYPATRGVLDSEIDVYNISQITKMSLTGYDNTVDYGSSILLNQNDPNVAFLPAVKAGSVYRIERQSASDQIYKIISIRENSQNEYNITASRYDTGKFETIEKSITQDFLENSYYTGEVRVGNVVVSQVQTPIITAFSGLDQTAVNFKLTGKWISGANGSITGFSVSVSNSLAGVSLSSIVNTTGIGFTGLTDIGNWKMSVVALAAANKINSSTATTGAFVAYSGSSITTITKPAIVSFSIR